MKKSDDYYIVPKLPACWFPCEDNRHGTCGQHVLKTIIEWLNCGPIRSWEEYSSGWITRTTWNMLPWNLKFILDKHGLKSEYFYCRWTQDVPKIQFLKDKIKSGPVILLISHAYSSKRNFSFRRAATKQHYISLWGYNDEKKVFYVYDSNVEKKNKDGKKLPAGNITISYDRLIWYRRLSMRWLHRNFGIAVGYDA